MLHAMFIAIYVALIFIFMPLSKDVIQIRVADCLCILPIFDKFAILSISIACFISNMLVGNILDAIFGTLATLIGLIFTYLLRKKNYFIATLPTILSNTLIIPFVLKYAYGLEKYPILISMLFVFIGEAISIYVFGYFLYKVIKNKNFLKQ